MNVHMIAAALAAALVTPAFAQGPATRHTVPEAAEVMLPEISVTYHRPAPANRYVGAHGGATSSPFTR
ncbi:hypothetical protein SAMN02799622_04374 [Methylobacterium sp. UNC378MF]|jgi:hypothetical protein|uniref:hypothetical protein n=1 Tax=Methylobacterium sp. UNC378MF TaxID=1502748 RepID=UPI00088BF673|nr:hypothetical protein [Methylobacterium sp. UNC378MF]SDA28928.1 hypothetical protein SAMN02799622_04374 [Methylobacterium sp. UNC378MF]